MAVKADSICIQKGLNFFFKLNGVAVDMPFNIPNPSIMQTEGVWGKKDNQKQLRSYALPEIHLLLLFLETEYQAT